MRWLFVYNPNHYDETKSTLYIFDGQNFDQFQRISLNLKNKKAHKSPKQATLPQSIIEWGKS